MVRVIEIKSGVYYDSIVLLQLQQYLSSFKEIEECSVVMGTEINKQILKEAQLFSKEVEQAKQDDLIIAFKCKEISYKESILKKIEDFLNKKNLKEGKDLEEYKPKSIETALNYLPSANWVSISVSGKYADYVAHQSLDLGLNVFLYSDNVPLEAEIELKRKAQKKGLLVLGPDCGTAIINGVGFGFANKVRKGNIGIIASSGTGLQLVTSYIHNMGYGISHGIGTGGRDLSEKVDGITTLKALEILYNDKDTDVIIIISKPPAEKVIQKILNHIKNVPKPIVINFLGYKYTEKEKNNYSNIYFASTLEETCIKSIEILNKLQDNKIKKHSNINFNNKFLRGLFTGGTIAFETLIYLKDYIKDIYSNIKLEGIKKLENPAESIKNTILDLGADEFTIGRLHPMIDPTIRNQRLIKEAKDKNVGIIILDIVVGYGTHPKPADELSIAIKKALDIANQENRKLEIDVILVGTSQDEQDINYIENVLTNAGAKVYRSLDLCLKDVLYKLIKVNSQERDFGPNRENILSKNIKIINAGLNIFYESYKSQNIPTIQLDWKPPAEGKEKILSILRKLNIKK